MDDPMHLDQHVSLLTEGGVGVVVQSPDMVDRPGEIVPPPDAAVALRSCIEHDFSREDI